MNDGPQADCHVGLSEINLRGPTQEIAAWLTEEMRAVNRKYIAKLIAAKCTSNMLMKLRNEKHGLMQNLLTGKVSVKVEPEALEAAGG